MYCEKKFNRALKQLTAKERLFVRHYLANGSVGKDAAASAGYKCPKANSTEILKRDRVQNALYEGNKRMADKLALDEEMILKELMRIAFLSEDDFLNEKGKNKLQSQMTEDAKRALAKLVRPMDKIKALELLGKNLKMFTDKVEHSGDMTFCDLVKMVEDEDEGEKPNG